MNPDIRLQDVSDGLAAAVERAGASTVLVRARPRISASGVLWSADGLVVTADHVLENEEAIVVGLPDGTDVKAELVGRDPGSDLALLRVAAGGASTAELAPLGATKVGHFVLAVGRPSKEGVQASVGVVSAVGGPWRSRRGTQIDGYLRSDTTFYPGFSGGPLVDVQGHVVGINSSRFGRGQGLTIEANAVSKVVELLRSHGRVQRAYLGVGSQQVRLPDAIAAQPGGQGTGLLIVSIEAGTPADAAGIMIGDILVGIDGAAIQEAEDLQQALGPDRVGATVRVQLVRGGVRHEVSATLSERK